MASKTVDPWSYKPSSAAAMLFLILFALSTVWHVVIMFRKRVWYFVVLIIGGFLEIAGYITRYLASRDNTNLAFFVIQTLCILVAPALFAASIYMVLGRLIRLLRADDYSPIRPTRLTKIFVLGDLISFIIQIMGAGMLTNNFNRGKAIILVGLVAQLVFFGLFVGVAFLVSRRLARSPTSMALRLDSSNGKLGWAGVIRVIFFTSALIFIRSVFRLIEFTGNQDAPMQKSEAYLYVCDSTLMFGVLAVLVAFHPSRYMEAGKETMQVRGEEEMM